MLLPAVTEKSIIEYGDFSGYFPGSSLHNRFPGQWQRYGHNYPSYAGFEGPYSTEYTAFNGIFGHPAQYAYPKHFGLPAVVEQTEEIVVEKPVSTGYYGYPGYYGYQNNFGYSPLLKETEEIVIDKPISTGFYGYPGYYGYQNHFGYSPLLKETEEIVIEKPLSTGFYGYPKHY